MTQRLNYPLTWRYNRSPWGIPAMWSLYHYISISHILITISLYHYTTYWDHYISTVKVARGGTYALWSLCRSKQNRWKDKIKSTYMSLRWSFKYMWPSEWLPTSQLNLWSVLDGGDLNGNEQGFRLRWSIRRWSIRRWSIRRENWKTQKMRFCL